MNSSWVPSSGGTRSKPCYARFLWAEMGAPELRLKVQLQKFLEKHLVLIGNLGTAKEGQVSHKIKVFCMFGIFLIFFGIASNF